MVQIVIIRLDVVLKTALIEVLSSIANLASNP